MKINIEDPKSINDNCQAECDLSWELIKKANSFPDNISPLLQDVYKVGYLSGVNFMISAILQQNPKSDGSPSHPIQ